MTEEEKKKCWDEFRKTNVRILDRIKQKSDKILSASIKSKIDAYNFIKLLFTEIGLNLEYSEDTTTWEEELRKYGNRCQTQQLSIYEADVRKKIIESLNIIEQLLGRSAIKMSFYNCRREKEDNAPRVRYMSVEEEVRECNRQFRSMMDDNDAWGNIE